MTTLNYEETKVGHYQCDQTAILFVQDLAKNSNKKLLQWH